MSDVARWEYCVLVRRKVHQFVGSMWTWAGDPEARLSPHERLNQAGEEGWELVSVVAICADTEMPGETSEIHYYLKRPFRASTVR